MDLLVSLTQLHGGRFTMVSQVGEGTTAYVHLPVERVLHTPHTNQTALAS